MTMPVFLFPHRFFAEQEGPPGAEPRIELGPALQQTYAQSIELHRTLTQLRLTLFIQSYAATIF